MIYFAEASYENNKFIKIGYSEKPNKRIQSLRTSCPIPIKLLGVRTGNRLDEASLHNAFQNDRIHGEWYKPSKDLLDTIKATAITIYK